MMHGDIYYYMHDNSADPSNTSAELACYKCLVNRTGYTKDYTNIPYLTTLARERYVQQIAPVPIDAEGGYTPTVFIVSPIPAFTVSLTAYYSDENDEGPDILIGEGIGTGTDNERYYYGSGIENYNKTIKVKYKVEPTNPGETFNPLTTFNWNLYKNGSLRKSGTFNNLSELIGEITGNELITEFGDGDTNKYTLAVEANLTGATTVSSAGQTNQIKDYTIADLTELITFEKYVNESQKTFNGEKVYLIQDVIPAAVTDFTYIGKPTGAAPGNVTAFDGIFTRRKRWRSKKHYR